ncbi:hypothetical protein [Dietzia psychralcaliphila]|uniref:hypothetical protein n=1 Tax=Dietzia psychralcaliphila TaxID=139021 RepID=UPI001C1E35EE|nr:hypothetical protein [Dietzia psychralcaliphila]
MTPTSEHRTRRRRTSLVSAAAGATVVAAVTVIGPTGTIAAYSGSVWANASDGLSAAEFRIESSLSPGTGFMGHTTADPLDMAGSTDPGTVTFTTPIALTPGSTVYAPVYLKKSGRTDQSAGVSISEAKKLDTVPGSDVTSHEPLWNTYITYGARAVYFDNPLSPPACNQSVFSTLNLTSPRLFGTAGALSDGFVSMGTAAPSTTFTLNASGTSTYMVCFRFTLASNVTTLSADSNGKSIHPYWVFTGSPL